MKKILIVISLIFAAAGCKNSGAPQVDKAVAMDVILPPGEAKMEPQLQRAPASNQAINNSINQKIIKEGEIRFKSGDVSATRKAIYASLKKLDGYVAEENETNGGDYGEKEFILNARIPSKNFELFLADVSSSAESIDSKTIRIKDATSQYIDLSAQLANKKKLEERYLELLKKGNKISDLLEIENKLAEIRTDVETTQGQLNYMMRQVEYSSLDITFYAKQTVKDNGQSFGYKVKTSFLSGWSVIVNLFFGLVGLWPLWLALILAFLVVRKWRRRRDDK